MFWAASRAETRLKKRLRMALLGPAVCWICSPGEQTSSTLYCHLTQLFYFILFYFFGSRSRSGCIYASAASVASLTNGHSFRGKSFFMTNEGYNPLFIV